MIDRDFSFVLVSMYFICIFYAFTFNCTRIYSFCIFSTFTFAAGSVLFLVGPWQEQRGEAGRRIFKYNHQMSKSSANVINPCKTKEEEEEQSMEEQGVEVTTEETG